MKTIFADDMKKHMLIVPTWRTLQKKQQRQTHVYERELVTVLGSLGNQRSSRILRSNELRRVREADLSATKPKQPPNNTHTHIRRGSVGVRAVGTINHGVMSHRRALVGTNQ